MRTKTKASLYVKSSLRLSDENEDRQGASYFSVKFCNVAERSKAWVCSRSPARIAGSNPAGGMDVCLL